MSEAAEEKNSLSKKKVIKTGKTRSVIQKMDLQTAEEYFESAISQQAQQAAPAPAAAEGAPASLENLSLDNLSQQPPDAALSDVNADMAAPAEAPVQQASPAVLQAAEEKAKQIKYEAQRHMAKAEEDAQSLYEEAKEHGYSDGMEEAQKVAKQEILPLMKNLRESQQKLAGLKNVIIKQNANEIIDLALDIARKVLGAELEASPMSIAKIIKAALNRIDISEKITVRIHPTSYEVLMKAVPDYLKDTWIVADSKVEDGGAIIETETGTYDAQIEEQLEEIEKNLKKDFVKEGP